METQTEVQEAIEWMRFRVREIFGHDPTEEEMRQYLDEHDRKATRFNRGVYRNYVSPHLAVVTREDLEERLERVRTIEI